MSVEATREFVDTNVLVYAFDPSAKSKHIAAARLVESLWNSGNGCLSVQVLQEFFASITRKVPRPLPVDEAEHRVRELTTWKVFAASASDVVAAIALHKQAQLSFWDAMIAHAAAELGCDVIWTEDLNDRQILRGVHVRNPFSNEQQSSS